MTAELDCVLLDLRLPDAAGMDAVGNIRARAPSVPLIVLTGLDNEAAGVAAVEAGAQDYLVKGTVGGGGLARSIRYAIGRHQTGKLSASCSSRAPRRRKSRAWNGAWRRGP